MLRKYSEVFRTLTALADLGVVAAALTSAYFLRFHSGWLGAASEPPDPADYVRLGAVALPLFVWLLHYRGLYQARRGRSRWEEILVLAEVSLLGTVGVAAVSFFSRTPEISRLTLALFGTLCAFGLIGLRMALRSALSRIRRRGYNLRRVLIVGTGELAREMWMRFEAHPETGFSVVGSLGPTRRSASLPPTLGPYEQLRDVVDEHAIDQVVIALDRSDGADPIKLIEELRDSTAAVRIAPDLLGLVTVSVACEDFDGLPLICLVESPMLGWNGVLKRCMDLAVASAALLLLAPFLAAIALAVRVTSPGGPVLYRQQRMSLDGRLFTMLKFRTMVADAESESGPCWAVPGDPRRTRIGTFLRSYNLDELPQLWNVLRGEMSLVGPRPERPELIHDFRKRFPGYMQRHKVKGGLTGLAQVSGYRGNTPIEGRLEQDLRYAQTWSLALDLKILVLTLLRSFRDPHAY